MSKLVIPGVIAQSGNGGGGGYVLPTATANRLGGIKVGENLTVEADGTLNAQAGGTYVLPPATASTLGGIKVGQNLTIESDGTLNAQAGSGSITRTYTNETGTTLETDIDFSEYNNIIVKKNGVTLEQDQIVHIWTDDVNPSLTADGTVGGDDYAAQASSEWSYQGTTSYAYTIFNPSFKTQGDVVWWTGNVSAPWWVTYYTPDAVKCKKVVFMNEIMTPATGKTGKIQGSNDNSTWVDLANVSIPNNDAGTLTEIQVNSNTAYKYFRFYFTESYAQGCSFQQITIYSEPSVIVRDYSINGNNIIFTNALVGTDTIVVQAMKSAVDASWGSITGTLSNQTDLQDALNNKLSLSGGTLTDWLTLAYDQEDPTMDSTIVMPGGIEVYSTAPYIFLNPTQEEPQPIEYAALSMLDGIEVAGIRDYSGTTGQDGYEYDNYRAQISLNPQYGTTKLELLSDSNDAPQLYRTYMNNNAYVSENVAWLDSTNKILANQLPAATANTLGGIKVGQNLTIEADGTLNATGGSAPGNAYTPENLVAGDGIEFNPVDPEVIIKDMTRYNYATINNALAFSSTPFSVEAHVKTPASGHYGAILGPSTANYPCFQFGFDSDNRVYFNAAPDAYSPVGIIETKSDPLSFNTEYWVKAEYTGTRYNLYVGTTKNNMQVVNYVDSEYVMITNSYNIGTYVQWSQHDTWTGEIWLSDLKVTINNVVVFDGSDSSQYTIVGTPTIVVNSAVTKIEAVNRTARIIELTTTSVELASGNIYNGSELASVTFTLPSTIPVDFIAQLNFTSGSTPTTFTAPASVTFEGDACSNGVFTPLASKRYSVLIYTDGVNVIGLVMGN